MSGQPPADADLPVCVRRQARPGIDGGCYKQAALALLPCG